jgi:hypothetical protein
MLLPHLQNDVLLGVDLIVGTRTVGNHTRRKYLWRSQRVNFVKAMGAQESLEGNTDGRCRVNPTSIFSRPHL